MQIRIIVLGDLGVGKTSILRKLKTGEFHALVSNTVGMDYFSYTFQKLDREIHVQFWDTAGQQRYGNITKQYYQRADGIVVIASAENSLKENVMQFEKYLKMNEDYNVNKPCMLIITKSDLAIKEDKVAIDASKVDLDRLKTTFRCGLPYNLSAKMSSQLEIRQKFYLLVKTILNIKFSDMVSMNSAVDDRKVSIAPSSVEFEQKCCQ